MVKLIAVGAEDDDGNDKILHQALSFFGHIMLALSAWMGMMLVGYAINPSSAPQVVILALSILIPLIAGNVIARIKPNKMAVHIWLAGVIWLLLICLWLMDMPTGPNQCMGCSAGEKLTRTLLSFPSPSGLIDDNGPFFGTWPSAALIGYAIGARMVLGKTMRSAKKED